MTNIRRIPIASLSQLITEYYYCYSVYNVTNSKGIRMKATFVSVWDGGTRIETACTVDESGEITTTSVDAGDVESLDREFVETEDGEELHVCPDCHAFIMKTVTEPSVGDSHTLVDVEVCSNPECESE